MGRRRRTTNGAGASFRASPRSTRSSCCTPPRFTSCDRTKQESLVDVSSGTFKIRVTGRATTDRTAKRSIVATFQREGFLKFVYFTDQENRDPQADPSATRRATPSRPTASTASAPRASARAASDISFASTDTINGPLHTNDESVLLCGSTTFGRETLKNGEEGKTDAIEVSGPAPGYKGDGCTASPKIWSPSRQFSPDTETMDMPESNQELVNVAASGGRLYSGKTIIRLKGSTMDVTNYAANGTATTTTDVAWPGNGVLYVANNGACNGEIPTEANYTESVVCGNAYVSGNYNKPLTIAAGNDVIIRPTVGAKLLNKSKDGDIKLDEGSDAVLGLIANNFVRVGHKVNRSACTNYSSVDEPMITDVRIDAAIMSLLHSFIGRQLQLRPVRGPDGQRRDRAALPRRGRHGQRRTHLHRLRQGLLVRRPPALPLAAVLPEPAEVQVGDPAHAGAGSGALVRSPGPATGSRAFLSAVPR